MFITYFNLSVDHFSFFLHLLVVLIVLSSSYISRSTILAQPWQRARFPSSLIRDVLSKRSWGRSTKPQISECGESKPLTCIFNQTNMIVWLSVYSNIFRLPLNNVNRSQFSSCSLLAEVKDFENKYSAETFFHSLDSREMREEIKRRRISGPFRTYLTYLNMHLI